MNMGMSYNQFWRDDPTIAKTYYEYYNMKRRVETKQKKWDMWEQGMYIYETMINVAPILHAFSKAKKPLPYPEKPYGIDEVDKEKQDEKKKEEEKTQEQENEKLRALVLFKNWSASVQKHFENEKR